MTAYLSWCSLPGMPISGVDIQQDWDRRNDEIALRLCEAREFLNLTQSQFGKPLGITRASLSAYEEGRAPLRCDLGLRLCRYFFISEFWLACGSVNEADEQLGARVPFSDIRARLTMALAAEQAALTLAPGESFGRGFQAHLRSLYLTLAGKPDKFPGFPRIVLLPNEGPDYLVNAFSCSLEFWKDCLSPEDWNEFFLSVISLGDKRCRQLREAGSGKDGQAVVKKK